MAENLTALIYDLWNTIFTQLAEVILKSQTKKMKTCGPLLLNILRPGYSDLKNIS